MFSGNDSTPTSSQPPAPPQNYTQWAFNAGGAPGANTNSDEIDWAALAQQWIIMKEAAPLPDQFQPKRPAVEEGDVGEAPMDVENDDEQQQQCLDEHQQRWLNHQSQWNWNGNGWPAGNVMMKSALLPTPSYSVFGKQTHELEQPGHGIETAAAPFWNSSSTATTTTASSTTTTSSTSSNSKIIKPHNKRYSKVNVPVPIKHHQQSERTTLNVSNASPNVPSTTLVGGLDATKRKQLPAWIREGLEKMERDKLKQQQAMQQMDKGRKFGDGELDDRSGGTSPPANKMRENALEILMKVQESKLQRGGRHADNKLSSYIDNDDDYSDDEEDENNRGSNTPTITSGAATVGRKASPIPLTQEELMLKVRRTMTEILLKVTNHEIVKICREERQRRIRKLQYNQNQKTKASSSSDAQRCCFVSAPNDGANLSAKLGLGAYDGSGDSSSENEDDANDDVKQHAQEKENYDSDAELRSTIRRRKEEFKKIEREIQNRLRAQGNDRDEDDQDGDEEEDDDDDQEGRSPAHTPPPIQNQKSTQSSSKSSSRRKHHHHRRRHSGGSDRRRRRSSKQSKYSTPSSSSDRSTRSSTRSDSERESKRRRRSTTTPPRKSSASARHHRSSRSRSRSSHRRTTLAKDRYHHHHSQHHHSSNSSKINQSKSRSPSQPPPTATTTHRKQQRKSRSRSYDRNRRRDRRKERSNSSSSDERRRARERRRQRERRHERRSSSSRRRSRSTQRQPSSPSNSNGSRGKNKKSHQKRQ